MKTPAHPAQSEQTDPGAQPGAQPLPTLDRNHALWVGRGVALGSLLLKIATLRWRYRPKPHQYEAPRPRHGDA